MSIPIHALISSILFLAHMGTEGRSVCGPYGDTAGDTVYIHVNPVMCTACFRDLMSDACSAPAVVFIVVDDGGPGLVPYYRALLRDEYSGCTIAGVISSSSSPKSTSAARLKSPYITLKRSKQPVADTVSYTELFDSVGRLRTNVKDLLQK